MTLLETASTLSGTIPSNVRTTERDCYENKDNYYFINFNIACWMQERRAC